MRNDRSRGLNGERGVNFIARTASACCHFRSWMKRRACRRPFCYRRPPPHTLFGQRDQIVLTTMGFPSFYFIAVSQFTSTCLVVSILRITGHVKVRGVFGHVFGLCESIPRYFCTPNPAQLLAVCLGLYFLFCGASDDRKTKT